jgi:hypothetical protein
MSNKVTINGVEYTPFEAGKNATELGIDTSRKFIVVNGNVYLEKVVYFTKDDNSAKPLFSTLKNDHSESEKTRWISLCNIAYYDDAPAKQAKPKFKVGDRVIHIDGGWTGTISEINWQGDKHSVGVKRDDGIIGSANNGGWSVSSHRLESLNGTSVSPSPKSISNTIITDIKDEAQHKRVQEKLLSLGNKQMDSFESFIKGGEKIICWGDDKYLEKFNNYQLYFDEDSYNGSREYKIIPASTFLQEEPIGNKYKERLESYKYSPYIFMDEAGNALKNFWSKQSFKDLDNQLEKILNNPSTFPREGKGTKIMSNIVNFFNDLTVSAEDKELRKSGLKDENLQWTHEAERIVLDLESQERGYKSLADLDDKFVFDTDTELSVFEYEALFTKFAAKLLKTATDFNKREEKKK